jgi:hypothetical protein
MGKKGTAGDKSIVRPIHYDYNVVRGEPQVCRISRVFEKRSGGL